MKPFYFCFSVDDLGMEGYSTPSHFENLMSLCDELKMKGTFFTVPCAYGKPFPIAEYEGLIDAAIANGHEIGQHGLEHDRFEMGIPPKMILDLPHEGEARKYLAEHPDEIEAALAVSKIRERLRTGRVLLQQTLGIEISGSRSPCASTCPNLYTALQAEGYQYDSSAILQEGAWDMIIRQPEPRISTIGKPQRDAIQHESGIAVYPIAAEYTWYLKQDQFEAFTALAKSDFDACLENDIPYVPVAHVSPIFEGDPQLGGELYRELIGHARQSASAVGRELVCTTLSDLHRSWTATPTSVVAQ